MSHNFSKELDCRWLGRVPYEEALAKQLEIHRQVVKGKLPHTLLLLEHPPVYTLGKRGGTEFLLRSKEELSLAGAEVVSTDRGGLVTFHGPGQLVGYPILHLPSLRLSLTEYISALLDSLVTALGQLGLAASASMERPGIWLDERKIGAVGVRLKERVTYHGFALNVSTDLAWFDNIVACGLRDVQTTSLAQEMGSPPTLEQLGRLIGGALGERLGLSYGETRPI
jgi:lipoyl(octanoyl) transferase